MQLLLFRKRPTQVLGVVIVFLLIQTTSSFALGISTQNVQAIAVYGPTLDQAHTLAPDQIVYNITSPTLIEEIIQGIEFTQELDCSSIGSQPNALVFIRFLDGSVARYQVINLWSQFGAYGFSSCCFAVSSKAQAILHESAQ